MSEESSYAHDFSEKNSRHCFSYFTGRNLREKKLLRKKQIMKFLVLTFANQPFKFFSRRINFREWFNLILEFELKYILTRKKQRTICLVMKLYQILSFHMQLTFANSEPPLFRGDKLLRKLAKNAKTPKFLPVKVSPCEVVFHSRTIFFLIQRTLS